MASGRFPACTRTRPSTSERVRESTRGFLFGDDMELTKENLISILDYEPSTGLFRWNKESCKRLVKGAAAGTLDNGYIMIGIDRKQYRAHRLAWLYVYGYMPVEQIDHVNGIKTDNRIENLRLATHGQNCANRKKQSNNTSGYKGVCFIKSIGKWRARIGYNNKKIDIGFFDNPKDAAIAYSKKSIELHKEFANFD